MNDLIIVLQVFFIWLVCDSICLRHKYQNFNGDLPVVFPSQVINQHNTRPIADLQMHEPTLGAQINCSHCQQQCEIFKTKFLLPCISNQI